MLSKEHSEHLWSGHLHIFFDVSNLSVKYPLGQLFTQFPNNNFLSLKQDLQFVLFIDSFELHSLQFEWHLSIIFW